ncbi:MAG: SET domain-containing protein-lysine N-methyltransferase [Saprospiraceae bacterium]
MKVCVLQPDYSTSSVDYKNYDPPRDLSRLMPGHKVDHVFLNKLYTYKQLSELRYKGYDIFVNLCEGYLDWDIPSIDVIYALEMLKLPFTGPTSRLYDPTKELMKYVAFTEEILTPPYALVDSEDDLEIAVKRLKFPLFVKPAKAGDSLGVDDHSKVHNALELSVKVNKLLKEFPSLLIEEYVDGREFTVLVAADPFNEKQCRTFKPVEYIFPKGFAFKTYALKTSELHTDANIPCNDPVLESKLRSASQRIFRGFGGVGYARMDFRVDENNQIYFLEINFTCSVFYSDGYEGSADYILKFDGVGQEGFLNHIVNEGIYRYKAQQKKYTMKGDSINGFGIYANQPIAANEIIFNNEARGHRIVNKRNVDQHWTSEEKDLFARYAVPLSKHIYILWDDDPSVWAPQNHSCNPNTAYDGLNVKATRDIANYEELTLDYATFLDETMEPFDCLCGSVQCRGRVTGTAGNTMELRESKMDIS